MMLSAVYGEYWYRDVYAPLCRLSNSPELSRKQLLTCNGDRNYYKKIYIKKLHATSRRNPKEQKEKESDG
jgi:hypothetical protein